MLPVTVKKTCDGWFQENLGIVKTKKLNDWRNYFNGKSESSAEEGVFSNKIIILIKSVWLNKSDKKVKTQKMLLKKCHFTKNNLNAILINLLSRHIEKPALCEGWAKGSKLYHGRTGSRWPLFTQSMLKVKSRHVQSRQFGGWLLSEATHTAGHWPMTRTTSVASATRVRWLWRLFLLILILIPFADLSLLTSSSATF